MACLADRDLGAVEQLLGELWLHENARLELEHLRVEGREDRPHPVLVEVTHDELGALGVVKLKTEDDTVLPDAGEPVRVGALDIAQPLPDEVGDVVHHRAGLGSGADLEGFQCCDAAEFSAAERRDVPEPVLGKPAR